RSDGTETHVLEENTYDAAGNTIRTVSNNGATTVEMTYDAAGRMTSSTADPAGLKRTTTSTYDADDNVVATTQRDASGAVVGRSEAIHNADGEVVADTSYPSDGFTPVGRWKLNETTGTRAADSAGNNPATLGAGATWSTERGGSLALNGTAAVEATGPSVDTARSFTVSAWAKLSKKDGAANYAVVGQDGTDLSGFFLGFNGAKDRWRFLLSAADDTAAFKGSEALGTSAPALNTWTHLTGVYDQSAKTTSLYVDGKLQGTAAVDATSGFHGPLTIGRGRWEGRDTDRWPGAISDVQVYQQALTEAQVTGVNGGSLPAADAKVIRNLYRYDRDGELVASTDPNGNTTYYAYDEAGQPVKETAPAATAETTAGAVTANAVSWTGYNTFGEVTDTKDPNGNWSVTVYDAEGRPVVERSPQYKAPGSNDTVTPEIVSAYDDSGRLAKVRDPLGRETSYVYDQLDRLSAVKTANGAVTKYRYNLLGDLEATTDPNGAVSTATWDYLGRQKTSTEVVRQTGTNHTTTYRYGFGGWESEMVTPGKVSHRTTYNALGETTGVTDGAGNTTTYSYDGTGQVVKVTLPDKTFTRSVYDLAGRQTRTSSHGADGAELQAEETRYDAAGNVVASIDGRRTVTRYAYDATGMLIRQVQPISASDTIETSFGYDQTGNRTRFTDGRGNAFWTTYNSLGLPESQVEPATTTHKNAADRTFTVAYDAAGRGVKQFLPGNVTITSDYDEMGQLTRQRGDGAEAATAAREFQYDVAGRLTRFSGPGGDNKLEYDDRDLPTSMSGPSGDAKFSYTPDGNLASRTDAAGTTSFGYDTAGRLSSLANPTAG
ncbi:MAG TPA: LamG-like jellyroll fold domain-containing protein, partial [Actinoplanes sp.]